MAVRKKAPMKKKVTRKVAKKKPAAMSLDNYNAQKVNQQNSLMETIIEAINIQTKKANYSTVEVIGALECVKRNVMTSVSN